MRRAVAAVALVLAGALPGQGLAQLHPDVPYVTTPANVVETMLEMAQVTANDNLIDLGAGDGRIVIEAAKTRGATGQAAGGCRQNQIHRR